MQDEDGYVTLNVKTEKPALTSGDPAASSLWRVMALTLLVLCMGMVFGLVALGILSITQQHYLRAENEHLSGTLKQLARKVCQDLIKQSGQEERHQCSPCEKNWRYHGDSCYGFFRHNLTWEESKKYCIDTSATLLKIPSQNILQYLTSRTGLIRWVGLSRQNSKEAWMWEDGSVPSKNIILFHDRMIGLTNLLNMLHPPLENFLAPSCALGGRAPMYGTVWVNLASCFPFIWRLREIRDGSSEILKQERVLRIVEICRL